MSSKQCPNCCSEKFCSLKVLSQWKLPSVELILLNLEEVGERKLRCSTWMKESINTEQIAGSRPKGRLS